MKVRYSEKKKIPIIEMDNEVEINMTSDDPIRWIMIKAKVKNKAVGITETLSDLVRPSKIMSTDRKIKRKINKKELNKINRLLKEYVQGDILTRENLKKFLKKI